MEFISGLAVGALSFLLIPYVFWSLLLVGIFISGRCVRDESDPSYFLATLFVVGVGFGLVHYFPNLLTTLKESFELVIAAGVAYLIAGGVYASGKWNNLSKRAAEKFKGVVTSYNEANPETPYGSPDSLYRFARHIVSKFGLYESDYFDRDGMLREGVTYPNILKKFKPLVEENKARISGWIAYWPLHGLNTLWDFLFEDLVEYVFNTIRGRLQRITDRHYEFADIPK